MSVSGRPRKAEGRMLLVYLLNIILVFPIHGCVCEAEFPPGPPGSPGGKVQILVQLAQGQPYSGFKLVWEGNGEQLAETAGETTTSGQCKVTKYEADQVGSLIIFPTSEELRAGEWRISIVVIGDDTVSFPYTICEPDPVVYSDRTMRVLFSQTLGGCAGQTMGPPEEPTPACLLPTPS